jgi:hypothetical protein
LGGRTKIVERLVILEAMPIARPEPAMPTAVPAPFGTVVPAPLGISAAIAAKLEQAARDGAVARAAGSRPVHRPAPPVPTRALPIRISVDGRVVTATEPTFDPQIARGSTETVAMPSPQTPHLQSATALPNGAAMPRVVVRPHLADPRLIAGTMSSITLPSGHDPHVSRASAGCPDCDTSTATPGGFTSSEVAALRSLLKALKAEAEGTTVRSPRDPAVRAAAYLNVGNDAAPKALEVGLGGGKSLIIRVEVRDRSPDTK